MFIFYSKSVPRHILTISFYRRQRNFDTPAVHLSIFTFLLPDTLRLRFLFIHVILRSFILWFLIRLFVFFFSRTHLHVLVGHGMLVVSLIILILVLNMKTNSIFHLLSITLLLSIVATFITLAFFSISSLAFFIIWVFFIYAKEIWVVPILLHVLFV